MDSRQAGMTDHRGHGFPTSESDRSQRAWISCPFWLSLSPPVKNQQNPSSPFLVILACPESFLLLILPHPIKKDSRQAGMTDRRGHGFPTSGNDRSQRAWIPDKRGHQSVIARSCWRRSNLSCMRDCFVVI